MISTMLLDVALLLWPSESRNEYRNQIHADVANRGVSAGAILDVVWTGLALRGEAFWRDLSYAIARLRRAPLFVAVVILTFALGIGVNVAGFSAFNAIVLRPLPFANADRLVVIAKRALGNPGPLTSFDVNALRSQLHGITSISGVLGGQATMMLHGVPKTLNGAQVSTTFFPRSTLARRSGGSSSAATGGLAS